MPYMPEEEECCCNYPSTIRKQSEKADQHVQAKITFSENFPAFPLFAQGNEIMNTPLALISISTKLKNKSDGCTQVELSNCV